MIPPPPTPQPSLPKGKFRLNLARSLKLRRHFLKVGNTHRAPGCGSTPQLRPEPGDPAQDLDLDNFIGSVSDSVAGSYFSLLNHNKTHRHGQHCWQKWTCQRRKTRNLHSENGLLEHALQRLLTKRNTDCLESLAYYCCFSFCSNWC